MTTLVVLIGLVFFAQGKPETLAIDLSTPEKTVKSFLTMYAAGEIRQAGRCVEGFQPTPQIDEFDRDIKKYKMYMSAAPVIKDFTVKIEGDSAAATVRFAPPLQKGMNEVEQVSLKRTGQEWKIVPLDQAQLMRIEEEIQSKTHDTFPLLTIMSSTLNNFPVLYAMRERARAQSCSANLQQLSLGGLMFLQDYDEVFKINAINFKAKIKPYIKNEVVFHCPSDKPGEMSYSFNGNLAGISMARVSAPSKTVLFYEGKNGLLNFRHRGRAGVSFVDGHTQMVDAAAAKKLRWKP